MSREWEERVRIWEQWDSSQLFNPITLLSYSSHTSRFISECANFLYTLGLCTCCVFFLNSLPSAHLMASSSGVSSLDPPG